MSDRIPFAEAVKLLPEGDKVHTFRNPGGMLIGADWSRDSVIEAMGKARKIVATGETAQAMHHGLAIEEGGSVLFIETRRPC